MRFLLDRCAGRRLEQWLVRRGHEVVESKHLGPDPGDLRRLELAYEQGRVLVTVAPISEHRPAWREALTAVWPSSLTCPPG